MKRRKRKRTKCDRKRRKKNDKRKKQSICKIYARRMQNKGKNLP
jgi:hypothetical protein